MKSINKQEAELTFNEARNFRNELQKIASSLKKTIRVD